MRTLTPSQAAELEFTDRHLQAQAIVAAAYAERARVVTAGFLWVAHKVTAFCKSAAIFVARVSARRRMIAELARLDDRLLADIGLSRSEIPAVVDAALMGAADTAAPASAEVRALNPQAKRPAQASVVQPAARAA